MAIAKFSSVLKREQSPWCQGCRQRGRSGGRGSETIKGARSPGQPQALLSGGRKFKHKATPLVGRYFSLNLTLLISDNTDLTGLV